ncbi:MAG: TatD family hydrolase [Verrucomicrobia bacterium]|nr:TatD family hydrolase [Verrucomicrobiota bacterium]
MKLFDAHCHLQDDALFPAIGSVLARAAAAGVERMACCGTRSKDWNRIFQLSESYPQIFPMIGTHPWFVKGRDGSPSRPDNAARPAVEPYQDIQTLENLLRAHPEAGIGETGLDFQERFTNRAEQEASFAAHLDLARELNRSVAVHCVHAWGRLIEILRAYPAPRVLLHAFGGPAELVPELVTLNCWFSFCGAVANPRAKRVRAAAVAVPEDRLLIETDSPDFAPANCAMPNEPANLIHVINALSELRGTTVDSMIRYTFSNAESVFGAI